MTRVHYAFDRFDDFQCNLFRPETRIWEVDDVCPAPQPQKTTCPPNWPSNWDRNKCKRCDEFPKGCKECLKNPEKCEGLFGVSLLSRSKRMDTEEIGLSIDATYCKENGLYTPDNLRLSQQNRLCCLADNFKINTREVGKREGLGRILKESTDICCSNFSSGTEGVDALRQIGCKYT